MKFIAIKTDDGQIKGEISFYCHMLKVSREGFRKYLKNKDKPWNGCEDAQKRAVYKLVGEADVIDPLNNKKSRI